jgi:DNA-binding transcriptional ArsR family regulator
MTDIDRVVHEPVRLRILMILSGVDLADFKFFVSTLGLSRGNLSSHMDKLERARFVDVQKSFNGKIPHTDYQITDGGRKALSEYWVALDQIRASSCAPGKGQRGE